MDHQKFNYCNQFENASKHECMSINNVNSICFIESSKQGFWSSISISFQVLPKIKTYISLENLSRNTVLLQIQREFKDNLSNLQNKIGFESLILSLLTMWTLANVVVYFYENILLNQYSVKKKLVVARWFYAVWFGIPPPPFH